MHLELVDSADNIRAVDSLVKVQERNEKVTASLPVVLEHQVPRYIDGVLLS